MTLRAHNLVVISSIDWDFLWQGPQELASRFADLGYDVVFVENLGVRAPNVSDTRRVLARLGNFLQGLFKGGARYVRAGVRVVSPIVLPPFGRSWQRRLNSRFFVPLLARRISKHLGPGRTILWSHLPTNVSNELLECLARRGGDVVTVYYCVDNFELVAGDIAQLRESERALAQRCDIVFAAHPELGARCSRWNDDVTVIPYGVNLETFDPSRLPHPRVERLTRPVIGYVGGIHRHVDLGLVHELARSRPDWSWVFVGPAQTNVDVIRALPNVHLMGQVAHGELAGFVQAFDVGIVPYAENPYTQTVVPTKINEYLAMGKPVVSTDLPAVVALARQHGVVEAVPARAEAFLSAIEKSLKQTLEDACERRIRVAHQASWDVRLQQMSEAIERKLPT